jgi:hypothetical protein
MSLEVYYPQDILNALLAAEQASSQALRAASGQGEFAEGYEVGYQAALTTLALAFGLVRFRSEDLECLASIGSTISGRRV